MLVVTGMSWCLGPLNGQSKEIYVSIIAHVHAHTHIYTHISVSQTGNTHQFPPFESNNPEFILASTFPYLRFPFPIMKNLDLIILNILTCSLSSPI